MSCSDTDAWCRVGVGAEAGDGGTRAVDVADDIASTGAEAYVNAEGVEAQTRAGLRRVLGHF